MLDDTKKDELEFLKNFSLAKYRINFECINTASVLLSNHSMISGAIYNMIAQINPIFSYKLHKTTTVKPWSYSLLKFVEKPLKTEKKGFSLIKRGMQGFFFLKTIDTRVSDCLLKYAEDIDSMTIGKLKLKIQQILIEEGRMDNSPDAINTVTIRLETPTFFYNSSTKKQESFTGEVFLSSQCDKINQLGIMSLNSEELFPYLWVLSDNTQESWGYLTDRNSKRNAIPFKGRVGYITFKIVGSSFVRDLIWKLIYLSEFTGIGTRTSVGFGHNSITTIK